MTGFFWQNPVRTGDTVWVLSWFDRNDGTAFSHVFVADYAAEEWLREMAASWRTVGVRGYDLQREARAEIEHELEGLDAEDLIEMITALDAPHGEYTGLRLSKERVLGGRQA